MKHVSLMSTLIFLCSVILVQLSFIWCGQFNAYKSPSLRPIVVHVCDWLCSSTWFKMYLNTDVLQNWVKHWILSSSEHRWDPKVPWAYYWATCGVMLSLRGYSFPILSLGIYSFFFTGKKRKKEKQQNTLRKKAGSCFVTFWFKTLNTTIIIVFRGHKATFDCTVNQQLPRKFITEIHCFLHVLGERRTHARWSLHDHREENEFVIRDTFSILNGSWVIWI